MRGDASKSIAIVGIDPVRYNRIVAIGDKLVGGEFRVQAGEAVLGRDLAQDLGHRRRRSRAARHRRRTRSIAADTFTVTGIVDLGVRDLNRRTVYVGLRTAQNLLSLPGGASQIDLTVTELFDAERHRAVAGRARPGLTVESWMKTNDQLLAAINAQTITTRMIRLFVVAIVVLGIAQRAGRLGRAEAARDRHPARDGRARAPGSSASSCCRARSSRWPDRRSAARWPRR